MCHDLRFCLGITTTHLTYQCPKCLFHMENSITELPLYNAYPNDPQILTHVKAY